MRKACSKCGDPKELSAFNRMSQSKDGHRPECRACTKKGQAKRYQDNRQAILAKNKRWYEANREQVSQRNQVRYYANHEQELEKTRQYRLRHPTYSRAYYYSLPKSRVRALGRKAYWKNPVRARAVALKSQKNNPTRVYGQRAKRRALLLNAPSVECIDRAAIIARDKSICHICKKPVRKVDITLDHLIPLSQGGPHTAQNLAVAHFSCNSRRGAGRLPAQLRLFS
jgi:hypothetical protein